MSLNAAVSYYDCMMIVYLWQYMNDYGTVMIMEQSIPVLEPSSGWVRVRSLAGITGSNPATGVEVCLL